MGNLISKNLSIEIAAKVNVEKESEVPAKKGATEHKNCPNIQFLRNAVIGVIVPDVKQTIISEQLNENINRFGTV